MAGIRGERAAAAELLSPGSEPRERALPLVFDSEAQTGSPWQEILSIARALPQKPFRDRRLPLTNATRPVLTGHRASEGLRQWRDKAGLTPEGGG